MQLFFALSMIFLGASAYVVGQVVTHPARERQRAVRRAATYGHSRVTGGGLERLRFNDRVLVPATQRLASLALRLNPRTTLESISARLLAAGMSHRISTTTFLALKGAGAVGGSLVGF